MTPFVGLHVAWLAGPASLGVLAVGVARLGRRATAGFARGAEPPAPAQVRAGGIFAAVVLGLSWMVLINGASRYPHVFVAAMFAWSLEALCRVSDPTLSHDEQKKWGAVLGGCAALMLTARPGDGATLASASSCTSSTRSFAVASGGALPRRALPSPASSAGSRSSSSGSSSGAGFRPAIR